MLLLLPFARLRRDNSDDVPCFVEDDHIAVFLLLDDQPVFRGQSNLADSDFLRSCGLFSVPHAVSSFPFPVGCAMLFTVKFLTLHHYIPYIRESQ